MDWFFCAYCSASSFSAEAWRNIIFVVGGVIGAGIAIWRAYVLDQQRKISRQSLYTDYYIRAVEQLGAVKTDKNGQAKPNLEVRMGAIFGLEQIAYASKDHNYLILGLLANYICENTKDYGPEKDFDPPRGDIYIALKSIGRRMKKNRPHKNYKPHLRKADFRKTDLSDFKLNHFNLSQARLEKAVLVNAQLEGADLTSAKLAGANLAGANMKNVEGLTQNQIDEAFGDGATELPENCDRPYLWEEEKLDKTEVQQKWWEWYQETDKGLALLIEQADRELKK